MVAVVRFRVAHPDNGDVGQARLAVDDDVVDLVVQLAIRYSQVHCRAGASSTASFHRWSARHGELKLLHVGHPLQTFGPDVKFFRTSEVTCCHPDLPHRSLVTRVAIPVPYYFVEWALEVKNQFVVSFAPWHQVVAAHAAEPVRSAQFVGQSASIAFPFPALHSDDSIRALSFYKEQNAANGHSVLQASGSAAKVHLSTFASQCRSIIETCAISLQRGYLLLIFLL